MLTLIVLPTGDRFEAQPYSMRAPEVCLGQACTEPSQVWAVAAMVLCWVKPGILGEWDSPHFLIDKAWSMAKDQATLSPLSRGARNASYFTIGCGAPRGRNAGAIKGPSASHADGRSEQMALRFVRVDIERVSGI